MSEGRWINSLSGWLRKPEDDWKPLPSPKSGRARELWAKEMVRREPYDLVLKTYDNPNYAKINEEVCRRKRSGGPWHCRHNGRLVVAETLELLFLAIVEKYDKQMEKQIVKGNVFRPPREVRTVGVEGKYKGTKTQMEPDPFWIHPDLAPNSRILPSEMFYKTRNR